MRYFVLALALCGCHPSSQSSVDAAADLADQAASDMATAPKDMGTAAGGDFGLDPNGKKGNIALTSGSYMLASTSATIGAAGASFQPISGATPACCPPPSTIGTCFFVGNYDATV